MGGEDAVLEGVLHDLGQLVTAVVEVQVVTFGPSVVNILHELAVGVEEEDPWEVLSVRGVLGVNGLLIIHDIDQHIGGAEPGDLLTVGDQGPQGLAATTPALVNEDHGGQVLILGLPQTLTKRHPTSKRKTIGAA